MAGTMNDLIELAYGDPACAKVLSNWTKDFVEGLIGKQILLDKRTHIFRRGLPGVLGLLFDGSHLSRPQADVLE